MTDDFRVHDLAAAKRKPRGAARKFAPVTVAKANPEVVRLAHKLLGPDQRLEIQRDGSIIIKNGRK